MGFSQGSFSLFFWRKRMDVSRLQLGGCGVVPGRWAPRRSRTCLSFGGRGRFPLAAPVLSGSAPLPVALLLYSTFCDAGASFVGVSRFYFLSRLIDVLVNFRNVSEYTVILVLIRCFVASLTGSSVWGVVFPPRPPPPDAGGGGFENQ